MKIKCGDLVFIPFIPETHFAEIGPGKMRDSGTVFYEVFPLVPTDNNTFVYGDSCWIPKKAIAEHYVVRSNEDFQNAWISLGFQPTVSENDVRFEKLFDHEHVIDSDCVESMSSGSDDTETDIRSNDSWSTEEGFSSETDSFIQDDPVVHDHCQGCELCQECRDTERWYQHDWHPTDPTETAVKRIIENIEEKYT